MLHKIHPVCWCSERMLHSLRSKNHNRGRNAGFQKQIQGMVRSHWVLLFTVVRFPAKSIVTKQFVVHEVDILSSLVRRCYCIILSCVLYEVFKKWLYSEVSNSRTGFLICCIFHWMTAQQLHRWLIISRVLFSLFNQLMKSTVLFVVFHCTEFLQFPLMHLIVFHMW